MRKDLTIDDIIYEMNLRIAMLEQGIKDEPYRPWKVPMKARKKELKSMINWIETRKELGL